MKQIQRHLGWKLFISYVLVIVVGIVSLLVTAAIHTPTAIERHMADMGMGMTDSAGMMSGIALDFQQALSEVLVVAGSLALFTAVMVGSFLTRRIVQPIQAMHAASTRIAAGHYDERVDIVGEDELAELGRSFNRMAHQIAQTEERRRLLIGNVAHELRTPLSGIKSVIEGLQDEVLAPTPQILAGLEGEVSRLQRLVSDLEELSRAEAGQISLEMKPIKLQDVVNAAVSRLALQFEEKRVALTTTIQPDLPAFLGDEARIIQVLINLLGNGLQYTEPGGRVEVQGRFNGEQLELSIHDSGIGIPSEHLPHIFDRFYRVDKSRTRPGGGSGIGLTISKHLVEAHGGRLSAKSPGTGQGSSFTISLPVVSAS